MAKLAVFVAMTCALCCYADSAKDSMRSINPNNFADALEYEMALNDPLKWNLKDKNIEIIEVKYPDKCEDTESFALTKEAIKMYFKNAKVYDRKSPVGVRDYQYYKCEILGKMSIEGRFYAFEINYGGVGYIDDGKVGNLIVCNAPKCEPCAMPDWYYNALEDKERNKEWLEGYAKEHCVRE